MVKTFLIQLLILREYMQWHAKSSTFEYENKESRKSNNHTKRSNWSSFREARHRNPD